LNYILNSGLIIPKPARPDTSAKNPRPITTTPADLKNKGAYFECAIDAEPNERKRSIGNVPRANANIINNPATKDPLPSADTCIDCVNPHGKKNVANPRINGAHVLCSIFLKKLNMPEGNVILFFANTPTKFRPSTNITKDAISPRIDVNVKLIAIILPIAPSTPPSIAKLISLPM
jgi:hypothetical protein